MEEKIETSCVQDKSWVESRPHIYNFFDLAVLVHNLFIMCSEFFQSVFETWSQVTSHDQVIYKSQTNNLQVISKIVKLWTSNLQGIYNIQDIKKKWITHEQMMSKL